MALLVQHGGEDDFVAFPALELVYGVLDEIRWQVCAREVDLCSERRDEATAVAVQSDRFALVAEQL